MKIFGETDRLILREILPTDIDAMFELDSDPVVCKYVGMPPIETRDQARETIRYIRSQYIQRGIGRWAVIEKSSGDFTGWSGLKLNDEKEPLDNKIDFIDIGFRFIPRYWGKGYATETSLIALDYGFKVKGYDVIDGIALIENIASNKVLQKIGLKHSHDFKFEDTTACWYHLKKEDYEKTMS